MMARRVALLIAALACLVLGATASYLFLSIPRDIAAESSLKDAQKRLKDGDRVRARDTFQRVVRDYPRTDAASAALWSIFQMDDEDREKLESRLNALKRQDTLLKQKAAALEAAVKAAAARPAPVVAPPPPPKKSSIVIKKRPPVKKKPVTRRRRR